MKTILTILISILAITGYAQTAECPPPGIEFFGSACVAIYEKEDPENLTRPEHFSYKYQEDLWNMSCATPGVDSLQAAIIKIQTMWFKYRTQFRCYNYPTVSASGKNILKFSMDSGYTGFIDEMVTKYKLDMNFIDPADGKTIMDYLVEKKAYLLRTPPVDESKVAEYTRIYNLLKDYGAKHAKDL